MRCIGRALPSLLSAGLFAALVLAKIIDGVLYEIPKTLVVPVIDGKQDAVWKSLDWNFQNFYDNRIVPDGWADLFGASKFMWDDQSLYGLFYTQDDSIMDKYSNSWERDGLEYFIDGDNAKSQGFDGVNDFHLNFHHEFINDPDGNLINIGMPAFSTTAGIKFSILDDTTSMGGYWLEFKIPLMNLFIPPVAGALIGLELQQSDNDGRGREHISNWWYTCRGDCEGWGPWWWGTAILSSRTVDDKLEIKKTPTVPVIDGVMDDLYAYGNPVTQNSFGNGLTYPVDFHDNFVRSYLLYDDESLYGFFDVYDDAIVNQHPNSWERDGIEIYTDADNSKGDFFDGLNDIHLTFRHEFIDNPAAHVGDLGFPQGTPTEGVVFVIVDDSLGYDIEFKIPLASLSITPEQGKVIGFEVQQNDNDGAGREHISKWWLEQGDDSWLRPNTWGTAYLGSLITTSVEEKEAPAVNRFSLEQNYPNPFNPSTKIHYTLRSNGKVRLSIHDVMGREVAVLVDVVQNAGPHSVAFSDTRLASGVYFYRLQTADEVVTKKMALVR
jgi:hypothetical protein